MACFAHFLLRKSVKDILFAYPQSRSILKRERHPNCIGAIKKLIEAEDESVEAYDPEDPMLHFYNKLRLFDY